MRHEYLFVYMGSHATFLLYGAGETEMGEGEDRSVKGKEDRIVGGRGRCLS